MLSKQDDIKGLKFSTIILGLVLFFSVMMCFNTPSGTSSSKSHPRPVYIIENSISAVPTVFVRVQVFQKTWILNKDNFDLLAFNRNPLADNKRTGLTILYYKTVRQSYLDIPPFFLRYHIFSAESDDLPVLS